MKRMRSEWRVGLMVLECPSMEADLMTEYQGEMADLREDSEDREFLRDDSTMEPRE